MVLINIILILISLVLIVVVLMQEGNRQGLGAIGGAAETFLGKNKSKSIEGRLQSITKLAAVVFVVLAILATWLNSRTYTIIFQDENGNEFYPEVEAEIQTAQFLYEYGLSTEEPTATYDDIIAATTDLESLRVKLSAGTEITAASYPTPAKDGYIGSWEPELPKTMGRQDITVKAVYTIGKYTLNVVKYPMDVQRVDENGNPMVDDQGEPLMEAIEPVQIHEATYAYGDAIDAAAIMAQVEAAPEGYQLVWSNGTGIPETMPGNDLSLTVKYEAIQAE